MKVMLDTSVIVPALFPPHPFYEPCTTWLESAHAGRFQLVATSHCLAETYAVLTRLPINPKISSSDAWKSIKQTIVDHAEFVDVPSLAYRECIDDLSNRGLSGGIVYDGIIAKAAELAGVDYLLTRNEKHFQSVWPSGTTRIISPLTHTAP